MFEKITHKKFVDIMEKMLGENIWLKLCTSAFTANIRYEDFEFLEFVSGKYQFGRQQYSEEDYDTLLINKSDILIIHRDKFCPTVNQEQLILKLQDGNEIIIETENC